MGQSKYTETIPFSRYFPLLTHDEGNKYNFSNLTFKNPKTTDCPK
jgi:hypothetical protein